MSDARMMSLAVLVDHATGSHPASSPAPLSRRVWSRAGQADLGQLADLHPVRVHARRQAGRVRRGPDGGAVGADRLQSNMMGMQKWSLPAAASIF
jgi:hypothetical protein